MTGKAAQTRGVGTLCVNGESRPLVEHNLARLLEQLGYARQGIAVALNDEVVPRSAWPHTEVRPDDRIEVIAAVQGG